MPSLLYNISFSKVSGLRTNYVEQSHAGDSVSRNVISPISADDALAVEIGGDRVKQHGLNGGAVVTNYR